ncbi:MAG: TGS domain-containing protein, partial [Fusobacteriaceae bacterium]
MRVILPSQDVLEFESGVNMFEVAKKISNSLAKKSIAAKIDGELYDMTYILDRDAKVEFITSDSEEGEEILRHSTAHLMADAVIRLFPKTKVAIGPAIENGFYYDFDPVEPFKEEDLQLIEAEMKKIVKENIKIQRVMMTREEAIEHFKKLGEIYKVEIIEQIAQGEMLSFYKQGEFMDLCRGPHVPSTGYLKTFKLKNIAGAYWRGDSKNKMLTRIYGFAFSDDTRLKAHLTFLEEAERRDHRKIGKELDLFF